RTGGFCKFDVGRGTWSAHERTRSDRISALVGAVLQRDYAVFGIFEIRRRIQSDGAWRIRRAGISGRFSKDCAFERKQVCACLEIFYASSNRARDELGGGGQDAGFGKTLFRGIAKTSGS